jgi:CRISPR/Cas system CMR subunit Cmr4 (Cas7 group RAMP superfamily)
MAISSGGRETGFDTQLARDANGLPYIPATSIAGVWRSLVKHHFTDLLESWFGETTHRSRLMIADGVLHDENNQPVQGLKTQAEIKEDKLLALLLQKNPHQRERVKINDRGVAANEAKFNQILLPTGVRFCIDIQWSDERIKDDKDQPKAEKEWQDILQCWGESLFVLGATTRNGLGRFEVVGCKQQTVELLDNPNAAQTIRTFMARTQIPIESDLAVKSKPKQFANLPIKALDNWRCGSGNELLKQTKLTHSVGAISYSEHFIIWDDNQYGQLSKKPMAILCGSSIKGILAHRVAFHLRRLQGIWAEDITDNNLWLTAPDELKDLFGYADEKAHDLSKAGMLYVLDSEIKAEDTIIRHHNNIDRFTGAVRHGALFSEELLYQPAFTISLLMSPNAKLTQTLQQALSMTLNDLKIGLLPMGAGSGRGNSLVMADPDGQWQIEQQQLTVQEA